jgi:anthranilate phosphoribosyltransferase
MSSKSGAADVLAALGVDVDAETHRVEQCLHQAKTCFLLAPRYHSAMRHVGPTRGELGTRTLFNLLGPLSSPAMVRRQVMGVFAPEWVEPLAHVLNNLGHERAWVVHGHDGLDELSTTGPSRVAEVRDGTVRTFEVQPEDAGLRRATLADLKGGDAERNAHVIRALLDGEHGPFRDIVLFAAGAALVVADRATDLREGAAMAADAVDSGRARDALHAMAAISHGQTPA